MITIVFVQPIHQLTQVPFEYKSSLPDFLLSFIDSIIRSDKAQILRYNFLHYTIDELLREDKEPYRNTCLFVDPEGEHYIFEEEIHKSHQRFPLRPPQSFSNSIWKDITQESFEALQYIMNPLFINLISRQKIYKIINRKLVAIDQIRSKCQSNTYFDPDELLYDIKIILAWNQLFRTKSSASFGYLTTLLTDIVQTVNKKNFHVKFYQHKKSDLDKLISLDQLWKIKTENWPYVPNSFRNYKEITSYEAASPQRAEIIDRKLKTKKQPVKCPENCSCLGSENNFCQYSLKDIWITECPNRLKRIECDHDDPVEKEKCLNSEIKNGQRRKCKKTQNQQGDYDIQECIIWGIDHYTRNIITYSLPECDLGFMQSVNNKEMKKNFIEKTFLKAINFNGVQGYSLKKACQFIFENVGKQIPKDGSMTDEIEEGKKQSNEVIWHSKILKEEKTYEEGLFSEKEKYYAQILLKNYELCELQKDKMYRIHTKGKGARCIKKNGIKEGRFIIEYYGQVYQPWKWYEREDFIKETLRSKAKDIIPQFYNIYLETHKDDPEGYDLLVVDPINKGNFSSRFSHSCNPNCGTVATISNGRYFIGMYAFRDIEYGEQLTFDYCSMTESNFEHTHSICLCGMEKCRGFYLELANSRKYSQILDKSTCFLSRNSLILKGLEKVNDEDIKRCQFYNIKERMLSDTPSWMIKWTSNLLKFMESESQMYKMELIDNWTKEYPWEDAAENKQERIQLYSQTFKQELISIRFQNLFTTVDKLKYFLNSIQDTHPPLFYLENQIVVKHMIRDKDSILEQLKDICQKFDLKIPLEIVNKFFSVIHKTQNKLQKLFYFRLCCLCVSHCFLAIVPYAGFNSTLLADIVYFYAFTHTFFSVKDYKSHYSEEISVNLEGITGDTKHANVVKKVNKKYSSQFVWGQLVSWYKQTIVSPQSSLSQDRRGTLSYPMIKSTLTSSFPHEKHCRRNFHKAIREKPASCWPSAPSSGCYLSFKNPFKCYGTMLFENIHNSEKLKGLGQKNLIENCLNIINNPLKDKINLFRRVEELLENNESDEWYEILKEIEKCIKFEEELPEHVMKRQLQQISKPRKRKGKQDTMNNF